MNNIINVSRELNRPSEPSCSNVCTDPGGGTRTSPSRAGCTVSATSDGGSLFFAVLFAAGGLVLLSRRRKRR